MGHNFKIAIKLFVITALANSCSDVKFKSNSYNVLKEMDANGQVGARLVNLPGNPSNTKSLGVKVENVSAYRYALVESNGSCKEAKYSTNTDSKTLISDTLGADGPKTLCVIGVEEGYADQATPTTFSWIKDTLAPGDFSLVGILPLYNQTPSTVSWTSSDDANTYNIIVSNSADCREPIQSHSVQKVNSVKIERLPDGKYFLCANSSDLAGNKTIASNNGITFSIDSAPPGAFNINRPFSISKVEDPEISWSQSEAGASYNLKVASDSACSNIVREQNGIAGTSFKFAQKFTHGGVYFICVQAIDAAKNVTQASNNGYRFEINTNPLTVSFSNVPQDPSNVSNLNVTVSGQADVTVYRYKIAVVPSSPATVASVCGDINGYSSNVAINTPITNTVSQNARLMICAVGGDTAGNWASNPDGSILFNSVQWTRSTILPVVTFSLASPVETYLTAPNTGSYCGPDKCQPNVSINDGRVTTAPAVALLAVTATVKVGSTVVVPPTVLPNVSSNRFTFNLPNASLVSGSKYIISMIARDRAGNDSLPVSQTLTWDDSRPVVSALTVKGREASSQYQTGTLVTKVNFVNLSITGSDSLSPIQAYCAKYVPIITAQVPSPVDQNDRCWRTLDPAKQAKSVNLVDLPLTLPFVPGDYRVNAWIKDAAGKFSPNFAQPVIVRYNPILPPAISNLFATYSESQLDPTESNTNPSASNPRNVYIRWKITTTNPNGLLPLKLAYSTDDSIFTEIGSTFDPKIRSGGTTTCTLSGTTSIRPANALPDVESQYFGCLKFTLPSTIDNQKFLRFRIIAEDADNAVAFGQTNALNLTGFTFLAGNTETGLGSTSTAAVLDPIGTQNLVVHPSGRIFILDQRGLLVVDPLDGALKLHELSSSITSRTPTKIALDKNDNILIYERDRIEKLDVSAQTPVLTTLIGGGTTYHVANSPKASPTSIKINPLSSNGVFFVAPNGDIYFQSQSNLAGSIDGNNISRAIYSENYQVETFNFAGQADLWTMYPNDNAPINPAPPVKPDLFPIEHCRLVSAAFTFNSQNQLSGVYPLVTPMGQTILTEPDCWFNGNSVFNQNFATIPLSPNNLGQAPLSPSTTIPALPNLVYRGVVYQGLPVNDGTREGTYVRYFQSLSGKLYARMHGNADRNDFVFRLDGTQWTWIAGLVVGNDRSKSGATGECDDGVDALNCALNLSAIFVDAQDQVYLMDNDVVRVIQDNGKILTIAGESKAAGDGRNPLSARFKQVTAMDVYPRSSANPKFVVSDIEAFRLRGFTENGIIDSVAGNGVSAVSPINVPAKNNSLSFGGDAQNAAFQIDQSNGNIYMMKWQNQMPYRINSSTGIWEQVYATLPPIGGYGSQVLGMNGTKILFSTSQYLRPKLAMGNGRLYQMDVNDPTSVAKPVLSKPNAESPNETTQANMYPFDPSNYLCPTGTRRLDCNGLYPGSARTPQAQFDVSSNKWIVVVNNTYPIPSRLVGFSVSSMSQTSNDIVSDVFQAPEPIRSFALASSGGAKRLYACLASGKIVKALLNQSTQTYGAPVDVDLPNAKLKCSAASSMIYSDARSSLIFSYELNGLQGVAEKKNP